MSALIEVDGFTGDLITPVDEGYDSARRIWNALHDKRPALIARCRTEDDIAAAIAYAQANDLRIAVRSGGHSMPGHSTVDDGIVIDLGPMNAVEVDPQRRVAHIGGGALLGDVDRGTQAHGLVVPAGVVSHTGVGGLTLGGGVGRLMRRYGLTIDSLLAARVVTANGQRLVASADENPDLFWALRGGGGNFGVVTEFEFALHPMGEVTVLATYHSLDDARALFQRAQAEMNPGSRDELLWTSFLRKGEPAPWMREDHVGVPGVGSLIEWSGDPEEGLEVLGRLRDEIAPAASSLDVIPFLTMQTMGDVIFGHGMLSYIKATFANALSDELVDVLCERVRSVGSEITQIEVLAMGGAIARVAPDATAFPHRDAGWLINIPGSWTDPADTADEITWVRETFAAIQPFTAGGAYANFMDDDDPSDAAYGSTWQRLREVKTVYDPRNVFRLNQNIEPLA